MTDNYHRRSLIALPDDIILQVFHHLEAPDVLPLSLVSCRFHRLSNLFVVWRHVFLNLLHRTRYIDLLAIDQKPLQSVRTDELKRSVLLAALAENNWLQKRPKARAASQSIELRSAISPDVSLDKNAYITKFTSKHLLIPLEGGKMVGWNLKDNTSVGSFDIGPDCMVLDLALEKPTRTLLGAVARVAPVRLDDSFGMHVRIGILRIAVPEDNLPQDLIFERTKEVTLLLPFTSEVHLLDVSRRMFCVAFGSHESNVMAILVMFDWDTEEAGIINTGIPYDHGRSLIGVHLSPEGDSIVLVSENEGSEIRRWYRLGDMTPSSEIWNVLAYESGPVAHPAREEVFKWEAEPSVLLKTEGTNAFMFWTIDQLPEPPYPEIPTRVSTIVLYLATPAEPEGPNPSEKTWRVAQYYSDKNGPCSPSRSILTLRNPALDPVENHTPIVCVSFNHVGWVEEVNEDGAVVRKMKLVTFPDPGTIHEGDLADTASTLDIPSDILKSAYHVLLDATQGLILVATVEQTLHIYRY
ncbi:hypothetical protein ACEPAH_9423 [Sanghuangporus vaninii]